VNVTNAGEVTRYNPSISGWRTNRGVTIHEPRFEVYRNHTKPSDYEIIIGALGSGVSKDTTVNFGLPVRLISRPTNFKIMNVTEGREVQYAFQASDGNDGLLSASTATIRDRIVLIEDIAGLRNQMTWTIY